MECSIIAVMVMKDARRVEIRAYNPAMWRFFLRPAVAWSLAAILIATTAAFTWMQWRLLNAAVVGQALRDGRILQRAAQGFADDFDREMIRVALCFGARGGESPQEALRDLWDRTAAVPDLVVDVRSVDLRSLGGPRLPPRMRLLLDESSLSEEDRTQVETPVLVIPNSPAQRGRIRSERRAPRATVVRLNREALTTLLATLTERHFSFDGEVEFNVAVLERVPARGASGRDADDDGRDARDASDDREPAEIFVAGPKIRRADARERRGRADRRDEQGDVRQALFSQAEPELVRGVLRELGDELGADSRRRFFGGAFGPGADSRDFLRRFGAWSLGGGPPTRTLELVVTHPKGSLREALGDVRRRNAAISLLILLLFSGALLLLIAAARRSQRLAAQQLDFVAGVTHELLTPLAAMRSAGQNLADGVVREEEKVRRYGALVEREGRRLSDLVSQVLDFAGLQSGRRVYANDRVDFSATAAAALEAWRALLDEAGFEIDETIEEKLYVQGDGAALERTLGNLIGNALKYAADGRFLALAVHREGREILASVADRGPGVDPRDLPHLFEPFYRGRGHAASNLPGSGLGLGLARHVCKHHGGSLDVESSEHGSTFLVRLPAAESLDEREEERAS